MNQKTQTDAIFNPLLFNNRALWFNQEAEHLELTTSEMLFTFCNCQACNFIFEGKSILQRALPLKNLKVNGKLLKGHQGQDPGQLYVIPGQK